MLIDARRLTALTALTALAAVSSACSPVDLSLGEAVKYDQALQTINPDPVYAPGSALPGASGTHAVTAAKAYRMGTVKPVEKISISGGSGSSGGSGPQ